MPLLAVRPWPLLAAAASPLATAAALTATGPLGASSLALASDWERAGARPRRASRRSNTGLGTLASTRRRARRPPAPLPQQAHFTRGSSAPRGASSTGALTAASASASGGTSYAGHSGSLARRMLARARARTPLIVGVLEIGQPARQVHVHVTPGRDDAAMPAVSGGVPAQVTTSQRSGDDSSAGSSDAPSSSAAVANPIGPQTPRTSSATVTSSISTEMGISITVTDGGRASTVLGGAAAAAAAAALGSMGGGGVLDSALRRHRHGRRLRRHRHRHRGSFRSPSSATTGSAGAHVPALVPVVGVISIFQ